MERPVHRLLIALQIAKQHTQVQIIAVKIVKKDHIRLELSQCPDKSKRRIQGVKPLITEHSGKNLVNANA